MAMFGTMRGANGKTVPGAQVINGQHLYFNADREAKLRVGIY